MKSSLNDLTPEQRDELLTFVKAHGNDYKWALSLAWMKGTDTALLRQIRNQQGPSWLAALHIPKEHFR
jgi:hypothetical protein